MNPENLERNDIIDKIEHLEIAILTGFKGNCENRIARVKLLKTYLKNELEIGTRIKDSEGNEFVINGYSYDRTSHELNGVSLKGVGGSKQISIYDIKFYKEQKCI